MISSSSVTCFGGTDGSITITNPAGGHGSYQYSINGGGSGQDSGTFTGLALQAAWKNPALLVWILEFVTVGEVLRWLISYLTFTLDSLKSWLLGWLPAFSRRLQSWIEPRYPALWLWLLTQSYALTDGLGRPQKPRARPQMPVAVPGKQQLTADN